MESLGLGVDAAELESYLETYQSSIEDQNHLRWIQQRDLVDAEPPRSDSERQKSLMPNIGCRGVLTETADEASVEINAEIGGCRRSSALIWFVTGRGYIQCKTAMV